MRAVVQRVLSCRVSVEGNVVSDTKQGILVYLGVGKGDDETDCVYVSEKVLNLRIFADEAGHMNRSVTDIHGEVCIVSQFTLFGDVRKGRRPSFESAADPVVAEKLYEDFCSTVRKSGLAIGTGVFRADMKVDYVNDGPVTILIDSEKLF